MHTFLNKEIELNECSLTSATQESKIMGFYYFSTKIYPLKQACALFVITALRQFSGYNQDINSYLTVVKNQSEHSLMSLFENHFMTTYNVS